jgi:CO/xanthine dehydrogenase Mo-binding subunit
MTGADIGPVRTGRALMDWPALASQKVRFAGERVAAVAAETPAGGGSHTHRCDLSRAAGGAGPGIRDSSRRTDPPRGGIHTPRQHTGYIEPHGALVWIDEAGVVHLVCTNKAPFALRRQFAAATGLPPEQIVVEPDYIGGDFGGKGQSLDELGA